MKLFVLYITLVLPTIDDGTSPKHRPLKQLRCSKNRLVSKAYATAKRASRLLNGSMAWLYIDIA